MADLRAPSADRYRPVVDGLVDGGVREIEPTHHAGNARRCRPPASTRRLRRTHRRRYGTDGVLARAALDAGAQFLVTPSVVRGAAEPAREHGVPVIMGALTPAEVMTATASGADLVKIFPASAVGAEYVGQLRGLFPDLRAVPSVGIGAAEARASLAAGAAAVSMGGPLIGDALNGGSLRPLTDRVRLLAEEIGEDVIT
ncbi:2-dehydro-3-deoxyphosphogluconate aldolase [Streptomyces sp. NPDC088252]|uniref:2-dehydro-3-deoxyphosphogluconate aldolase n=1 Tax=Streptomyces sp. NPDC088252 TaxID=3365845 RepID=UPI003823AB57